MAPEEPSEDQAATGAILLTADQSPAYPPEGAAPELPETGPAPTPRPRNTRNNPVFSDEEFTLELPDYNPLLE
jgi:hypothetical protein